MNNLFVVHTAQHENNTIDFITKVVISIEITINVILKNRVNEVTSFHSISLSP